MRTTERWIAGLFLAVALLQIAPVWSAPHFPTADGPAHLYNAWVMREIALRHDNAVTRAYAIDAKPYPNLLDHVALAVLLGIFPPAAAEKVFVSAIILLFLGGAWLFAGAADPRASLFAFLAMPLAHHQLLQSGFYNFSASAGLYFVIVALWWRRRHRADGQTIALVALLLLLCYFAHPLSTALAISSIGLLWLATSRDWRHLLAFVPVLPLLAWFVLRERGEGVESTWRAWHRLTFLAQTQNVVTFEVGQMKFGAALFAITVLLIAITIAVERRRREADAFLLVLAAVFVAYELAPSATAGGSMILERFALFLALLPLPWLTPRLTTAGRAAFVICMAIVALVNCAYLIRKDRQIARETTRLVRAARAIPPNRTFYPIVVDRQPRGTLLALMWHAPAYAAIERHLVDLNNYEPGTGYFPIRYRDAAEMKGIESIADNATDFDVSRVASVADYVFTWQMPLAAPVLPRLDDRYTLVDIGEARVYRRKLADADEVLLPLAGTAADAGGPFGERWGVDQTMHNRGTAPAEVELNVCCAFTLAPGETKRITANEPYLVARIARSAHVDVETVVHRIDRDGTTSRLAIPSIPLSALCTGSIDFAGAPPSNRLTLRVWSRGATAVTVVAGALRRSYPLDAKGFAAIHDLPLMPQRVEANDRVAQLWGFVTATGERGAGALLLPRCGS